MLLLAGCIEYGIDGKADPFDTAAPVDSWAPVESTDSGAADSGTAVDTEDSCPDTGAAATVEVSDVETDPDAGEPVCSDLGAVDWHLVVEWSTPLSAFAMGPVAAPNAGRPGASVFVDSDGAMIELDGRDGTELQRVQLLIPDGSNDDGSMPTVADVDGDGDLDFAAPSVPFVHVVDTGTGGATWFDATPSSGYPFDDEVIQFADVDLDGTPELVMPSGVFELDGTRRAATENFQSTQTFVTDLDGDRFPEWVTATGIWDPRDGTGTPFDAATGTPAYFYGAPIDDGGTGAVVFTRDTKTWSTVRADGSTTTVGGPLQVVEGLVAVGDVDGDGEPDVVRVDGLDGRVQVTDAAGSVLREWSLGGVYSGGVSLADLDADGTYEIVVLHAGGLTILSGVTGEVLADTTDVRTASRDSAPIIADVDGDGSAEIVFAGTQGDGTLAVLAVGPASGRWARARPIWNQLAYDAPMVRDDGTLAPLATPGWQGLRAFRAQPGRDGAFPDLAVSLVVDGADCGLSEVTVRVRNVGSEEAPAGAEVRLSAWDGSTLDVVLDEALPAAIPAGGQVELTWTGTTSAARLVAEVVPAGPDCDALDDEAEWGG